MSLGAWERAMTLDASTQVSRACTWRYVLKCHRALCDTFPSIWCSWWYVRKYLVQHTWSQEGSSPVVWQCVDGVCQLSGLHHAHTAAFSRKWPGAPCLCPPCTPSPLHTPHTPPVCTHRAPSFWTTHAVKCAPRVARLTWQVATEARKLSLLTR